MSPNWEVERERFHRMHCKYSQGRRVSEFVMKLVENIEGASMEEAVLPIEEGVSYNEGKQKFKNCQL